MQDWAMDEPFSMEDLEAALENFRRSSSPGSDNVTYATLRHLDHESREILLRHLNLSWSDGVAPSEWNGGRLVPLLTQGKPPLALTSYRPIALASCVLTRFEGFLENFNV